MGEGEGEGTLLSLEAMVMGLAGATPEHLSGEVRRLVWTALVELGVSSTGVSPGFVTCLLCDPPSLRLGFLI